MITDKKSQLRTITSILLVLTIFSLLLVMADNLSVENLSGNLPAGMIIADDTVINMTDINYSLESSLTIQPEIIDINNSSSGDGSNVSDVKNETTDGQTEIPDDIVVKTDNVSDDKQSSENEPADNNKGSELPIIETTPPRLTLRNSKGHELRAEIKEIEMKNKGFFVSSGGVGLEITPENMAIKQIVMENVDLPASGGSISLGIEELPLSKGPGGNDTAQVYAIDPTMINFTVAQVTVLAKGNELYKCQDYDFQQQECYGKWNLFLGNLTIGKEYTFELTPEDPAFGEIIATSALHLDQNYFVISDIYNEVKSIDGVFSEPIYENEIVRVIFEKNLTSENYIDFIARSNNTLAYFDVYIAGTQEKVAQSAIISDYDFKSELRYIKMSGLKNPADTFDFKIVKVVTPQSDVEECFSMCAEDNSNLDPDDETTDCSEQCYFPTADVNRTAFLKFDYIHDAEINSTNAKGLVGYSELDQDVPRYRLWNQSITSNVNVNFSVELNANSIGGATADITWVVVKGNHERDEMIMGTEDKDNDVNIQIFNSSQRWEAVQEISTSVPNSAYRAFDLGYEDISGDSFIVYEINTTSDSIIGYREWNGTSYTAAQELTLPLVADPINWLSLAPRKNSNEMMLLAHSSTTNDLAALFWNGTGFVRSKNATLNTSTVSNIRQHFAFDWESSSGDGIAFYGTGNLLNFVNYTASTETWSAQGTVLDLGNGLDAIRVCPDPNSDYVGVIVQDAGNDVNVRMWNGSEFLSSPPTQNGATEPVGADNVNVDCAWINSSTALFGYINSNSLNMNYFTFSKSNTWSIADLTTAPATRNFGQDDISSLRFNKNPVTNEVMIMAMDIAEAITAHIWNGTNFDNISASPLETTTEVLNGDQEGVMFDWYRFDTPPAVNVLNVSNSSIDSSASVVITANVTDNISVGNVYANVTIPNGTIEQVVLVKTITNSLYNGTFSRTQILGNYSVRTLAFDNSTHFNVNNTVTTSFVVRDTVNPSVLELIPINRTIYNVSNVIEIAANVTDNAAVSRAFANISYPNGTITQLALSNKSTFDNKFNNSFTIPGVTGNYNVTFFANDSSGNKNRTSVTNFTVNDIVNPSIPDVIPVLNSRFNHSITIDLAANVTDDVNVSRVIANVSYPNGTNSQVELSYRSANRYNNTFTIPVLLGRYNLSFFANDSSNNENRTVSSNFTVADGTPPLVFSLKPANRTTYNVSNIIEISANVTDEISVSRAFANVSYPNGTVTQLTLSNKSAFDNQFNNSFTAPALVGNYNVTFFANDSSGNENRTEQTNFTINDAVNPSIPDALPIQNTTFNSSTLMMIAANVTDDVNVSRVIANVSYPNGTLAQVELSYRSANRYNNTFVVPTLIGHYNITFFANDSSNNQNRTITTNFTVTDGTPPLIFSLLPINNTVYNVSNIFEISANVTDEVLVSRVFANISHPNGTIIQLELSNKTNFPSKFNNSFTVPAAIGNYNVTFFANDSSANENRTSVTNFTINDIVNPSIPDVIPVLNSRFNHSITIDLAANVTDDVNVSRVIANVSYPNGTNSQVELSYRSANRYNNTFTIPVLLGRYNLSFFANDSSNNQNQTMLSNFTVVDQVNPLVFEFVPPNRTNYNISNTLEISANVTDVISVSRAFANVSYPNGTITQLTLSNGSGFDNKFNNSFTVPAAIGNYNVTFFANDSSGNENRTERTNFTINDVRAPNVTILNPTDGQTFPLNSEVVINANITDQIAAHTIYANVTLPNSSIKQNTMTDHNSDGVYNVTFNQTASTGSYVILIFANDTSGNINATKNRTFVIQDVTAPIVNLVSPTNGQTVMNSTVTFICNATDNTALNNITLYHNITGTFSANATNNVSGVSNVTNFTSSNVADGNYLWNCLANDSDGNTAFASMNYTFTLDTSAPRVFNLLPAANSFYNASDVIQIAANATDASSIFSVLANITYPNSTINQVSLSSVSGTYKYNNSFTAPALLGNYNVTIIATDTNGFINSTAMTNFTVQDRVNPSVPDYLPSQNSRFNYSAEITIAVNVTDDVNVSRAIANVTYPNGTNSQLGLSYKSVNRYNNTFTIPALLGLYNITFFANDSSDNQNRSIIANFTVVDSTNPSLPDVIPAQNSIFNHTQAINLAVNATDDINVSRVIANLTYLNNTIRQIELNYRSENRYNNTFALPAILGVYNLSFFANDSSNNQNRTVIGNFTIQDRINPNVTALLPSAGSSYNVTETLEVAANVTDGIGVNIVFANVTYPNGTVSQLTLNNKTNFDNKYNNTFTIPALIGRYNITMIANDTSGNLNATETTYFTAVDVVSPTISILGCANGSFYLGGQTRCMANISDNVAINTVIANVTLPNGTVFQQSVTNVSSNYTFNFTYSARVGQHNITWFANDTSGNIQTDTSGNFNITDVNKPAVNINGPVKAYNSSSATVTFNITAIDDALTDINCSIIINGTKNSTNSGISNNTATTFSISSFTEGNYIWNATCNDASGNSNNSESRTFAVDLSDPGFIRLFTSPDSENDLDPNINISVFANVTENITALHTVILQRKLSNASVYTNSTLVYNATSRYFEGSFNATQDGTYNLSLFANDTAGNDAFSNSINFSVEYEKTWSRTPSSLGAVSASLHSNVSLGSITINNTGDYALNFSLNSSTNTTYYNVSYNLRLAAKTVTNIAVYDNASTAGVTNVQINMTTSADAVPSYLTTTGSIVVAPGQPILVATFTTPTDESVSLTQGDTNVDFIAKLENIGEGNASNVTFFIDLPSDWTITFGSLNQTFSDFLAGDVQELSIQVAIPADASTGSKTIIANSTGFNVSGSDLSNINDSSLIFSDAITATVSAVAVQLGAVSAGAGTGSTTSGGITGGGGGGGSGAKIIGQETIYTQEVARILRGKSYTFPLTIKNTYNETILNDVKLDLSGFISSYINWEPKELDGLKTLDSKDFLLTINVPSYLGESEYVLTARISGVLTADKPAKAGYTQKRIVEYRTLILKVEEVSEEDLSVNLEEANRCILDMENNEIPSSKVNELLRQAQKEIENKNYKKAKELLLEICDTKKLGFTALEIITKLEEDLRIAKEKGLQAPGTEEKLALAKLAFSREDFALAADRSKEGELTYLLETKGRINVIAFIRNNWRELLLASLVLFVSGIYFFNKIRKIFIKKRIFSLNREEANILDLIVELQKDYLQNKKISASQYKMKLAQYSKRIAQIKQVRVKLRNKKAYLFNTAEELSDIQKEKKEMQKILKETQGRYFLKKEISKQRFDDLYEEHKNRVRELEHEEEILQKRVKEQKVRGRILRIIKSAVSSKKR